MRIFKIILGVLGLGVVLPAIIFAVSLLVTRVAIAGHSYSYSLPMLRSLLVMYGPMLLWFVAAVMLAYYLAAKKAGCSVLLGAISMGALAAWNSLWAYDFMPSIGFPPDDAQPIFWALTVYGCIVGFGCGAALAES